MKDPESGDTPKAAYPPDVYAPRMPDDLSKAPPASLVRWFTMTAAAGLPAGLLWWLCAPGGAFYGDSSVPHIWLPRELVLGLIGLVAGIAVGWLVARQRSTPGSAWKAAAAAGGSILGSIIAWQTGEALGAWLQPVPDGAPSENMAFSVMSYGVLLIWPAAMAVLTFAVTLTSLLRTGLRY
ncbi:MAG TPA: hypothetical protein VFM62_05960 [Arthrobacter sp.]|nr:hypothetical protein [Arthrobacter sp.]